MAGLITLRSRERFKRFLEKRFSLRLHMFLILSGVFCAGVLSSKLLLMLHIRSMLIRYPLAVLFSYLAFFGFVKLWLIYLSSSTAPAGGRRSLLGGSSGKSSSFSDLPLDFPGSGSGGPSFGGGGGGTFGGGGASASFDGAPEFPAQAIVSTPADSGGGLVGDVAKGAGKAISGIFDDEDAAKVLLILAILLAIVFGAGAYLIYQAPVILSDAAFQGVLSASLIRSMKKMSDPDWMSGVLRTTAVPFLIVLGVSIAAAWVAHSAYPEAAKMSEVVRYLLR